MDQKNPFSEASKERRRLQNERNSLGTKKNDPHLSRKDKRNLAKENLVDLKRKDNISPKGLYV